MTLLPIATRATSPNGVPADAGDATSSNGDFAALLALVAGIAPLAVSDPISPEGAVSDGSTQEPGPAGSPTPAQPQPSEHPVPRVSPMAIEASPVLTEVPPAPTPAPDVPAAEKAEAVVVPPSGRARVERPAVRVPASPVAAEASPTLVEVPPSGQESPQVPQNLLPKSLVPERRIPEQPRIEVQAPAPLPMEVVRAEATVPADTPAATPVAPPAVPEQIVSAVVPLHGRGDGRHEVTLELRPADLGPIRVEVSVEQQTVHLTLHAAEPATGRLLSAALADLRSALVDAGLQAGHLAVAPDGGGGAAGRRARSEPPRLSGRAQRSTTPETVRPETVRTGRPTATGRLDLFL